MTSEVAAAMALSASSHNDVASFPCPSACTFLLSYMWNVIKVCNLEMMSRTFSDHNSGAEPG